MKPQKTHMAIWIAIWLLLSCNPPTPLPQVVSNNTALPDTVAAPLDTIPVANTSPTADTTTKVKKTPLKTTKPQKKKATLNATQTDKKAPSLPIKRSSGMAKENKPQKIIGNEYFEVVEGFYCNDDWSGNPYYVGCTNCRFCREIFIKNKSKEHIFFKEAWCGNTKKEVNMWAEAEGIGEHIVFCISARNTGFEIPSPIPYEGQALISYTVGSPNAEIRYFDVTNLIKWCGKFYIHKRPDPKGGGPYK